MKECTEDRRRGREPMRIKQDETKGKGEREGKTGKIMGKEYSTREQARKEKEGRRKVWKIMVKGGRRRKIIKQEGSQQERGNRKQEKRARELDI